MPTPLRCLTAAAALGLMLLATSCAADHPPGFSDDAMANHPISVVPQMASLDLSFATPAAGLLPDDEARLQRFVTAYRDSGTGAISIEAPEGRGSEETIRYFGERLRALGVPEARILVGTGQTAQGHVALSFVEYRAETAPCGNWGDVAKTGDNLPMRNLGCASQHNLAAMVADPRDLIAPRTLGPSDASERTQMIGKYEQGQPTEATKSTQPATSLTTND